MTLFMVEWMTHLRFHTYIYKPPDLASLDHTARAYEQAHTSTLCCTAVCGVDNTSRRFDVEQLECNELTEPFFKPQCKLNVWTSWTCGTAMLQYCIRSFYFYRKSILRLLSTGAFYSEPTWIQPWTVKKSLLTIVSTESGSISTGRDGQPSRTGASRKGTTQGTFY